jgi:ribonuclease HI
MELTAAIEGLSALKEPCKVKLYSDSQYLVNAINKGWLDSWKAKGWRKADKSPVLNDDLWKIISDLLERHTVEFIWVKGHDGQPYNERCDALASGKAESLQ